MSEQKEPYKKPPAVRRKKQLRRRAGGDIDWRDPLTWVSILLLIAIGFGGAYGLWWRTWQLDQARELDWYVKTSQVRLRDFQAKSDAFFSRRDIGSLAMLSLSASSLNGTLAQIPRRGPVEWRAEMIGLGETLRGRLSSALNSQLTGTDETALAALADLLPVLRDKLHELDQALDQTVVRADHRARRTNWTPEVVQALLSALRAAREEAAKLPE